MEGLSLVDKMMTLKSIDMFQAVHTENLMHVARVAHERKFARGETLFDEGDPAGPLFIVLSGHVSLQRGDLSAGEIVAGDALGAWSLFDDQPRSLSALAIEPTSTLAIEREDFYDVLGEHVEIVQNVVGHLVKRLRSLAI